MLASLRKPKLVVFAYVLVLCAFFAPPAHADPPKGQRLMDGVFGPFADDAEVTVTSVTNTSVDAFAALSAAAPNHRLDSVQQQVIIYNDSPSVIVCVKTRDWTDTCANLGAAAMTCMSAGGANNGRVVPPKTMRPFRYDGTERLCLEAAAAGPAVVHAERRVVP